MLPRRLRTTEYGLGRAGGLEGQAACSGDATPVLSWVPTALFQDTRFSSLGLNLFIGMGGEEEAEKQGILELRIGCAGREEQGSPPQKCV